MKKIALLCVICLLLTALPCAVSAEGEITATVSDVSQDIVTVSGSAPVDTIVTVMILNPGKTVSNIAGQNIAAVQYMGSVYSSGGTFTCNVKMDTGTAPNKNEGAFTVLVSIGGKIVYSNENFVFYSNDTKMGYVNDLKTGTQAQLLAIEADPLTKIEKIFETYSLSNHELYKEATKEELAKVIVAQTARTSLASPTDAEAFLSKVLVLNAFDNASAALTSGTEFKYTEIWAKTGSSVDTLYTDNFVNDLSPEGKNAVIKATTGADYSGAQFGDIFEVFEEAMLFNLIMNNALMGSGHIEGYVLTEFNTEYEAAGFTTSLLSSITNSEDKVSKLDSVLSCGATTLSGLATKFDEIMSGTIINNGNNNNNNNNTTTLPSTSVPSGGGGGGFVGGSATPTPAPTETPASTASPEPTTAPAAHPFTDMSGSEWAEEAVKYLYENKIVAGRTETEYVPVATVTRAELVKMITEALKVAEATEEVAFNDVGDTDWFAPYVKRAAAAGIVVGDGGTFRPSGEVTREDAALIIYRALALEAGSDITFTDADDISDYAKEAIAAMVRDGYISGMGDGTFAPKATLTRAQAAQLIYNAITKGGAAA